MILPYCRKCGFEVFVQNNYVCKVCEKLKEVPKNKNP
jgi:hypothetical protein